MRVSNRHKPTDIEINPFCNKDRHVERLRKVIECDGKQVRPGLTKPEWFFGLTARGVNEAWVSGFHRGQQRDIHCNKAGYKTAA